MEKDKYANLTLEELKKKQKDSAKIMGFFLGILIVYLVIIIIAYITTKSYKPSVAALLCFGIISYVQRDSIKGWNKK